MQPGDIQGGGFPHRGRLKAGAFVFSQLSAIWVQIGQLSIRWGSRASSWGDASFPPSLPLHMVKTLQDITWREAQVVSHWLLSLGNPEAPSYIVHGGQLRVQPREQHIEMNPYRFSEGRGQRTFRGCRSRLRCGPVGSGGHWSFRACGDFPVGWVCHLHGEKGRLLKLSWKLFFFLCCIE